MHNKNLAAKAARFFNMWFDHSVGTSHERVNDKVVKSKINSFMTFMTFALQINGLVTI